MHFKYILLNTNSNNASFYHASCFRQKIEHFEIRQRFTVQNLTCNFTNTIAHFIDRIYDLTHVGLHVHKMQLSKNKIPVTLIFRDCA